MAYIVELLDMYVQGELSPAELARVNRERTKEAQFLFFHMPEVEIRENQRIFTNEFAFADTIYKIMQKGRQTDKAEFTQMLLECVEEYAASYTDRKPPAV